MVAKRRKNMKKVMSTKIAVVMSLVLAMSMMLVACGNKATTENTATEVTETVAEVQEPVAEVAEVTEEPAAVEETEEPAVEESADESADIEATVVGEGAVAFTFEVVDGEGNTTFFTVNTDKATVGEALLDNGLVEGEDSDYGLYVKTVNGITADYDVDQTYWAFYIDGEYAMTGVDSTDVVAGSTYSFKVEK